MTKTRDIFTSATEIEQSPDLAPEAGLTGVLSWEVWVCILLIVSSGLASVLAKCRQQGVLANAYFAGRTEKFNAMRTAIAQSNNPKIDELALFIGREEDYFPDWKTLSSILISGCASIIPLPGLTKSLIGLGPPESGKTYSLQKPLLRDAIRQGQTIICLDPKGDLAREIAPFARARDYQDFYLNLGGDYSDSFNILQFMESELDSTNAEQLATSMYKNGWGSEDGN